LQNIRITSDRSENHAALTVNIERRRVMRTATLENENVSELLSAGKGFVKSGQIGGFNQVNVMPVV
jgi:hypothetical protein